jgi:TM2 domain-containing membrane protein YozV
MQAPLAVMIVALLLMFGRAELRASITELPADSLHMTGSLCMTDTVCDTTAASYREPYAQPPKETFKKKKLVTCILAFPVPFGFVGLHRIYLGTDPWVPVVYLCTGGGGAGLLPLIDFIFLVTATEEEFKRYENNPNVFMFVK